MTQFDSYEGPRSIFTKQNIRKAGTRSPSAIHSNIYQEYWQDPPKEDHNSPMDYFEFTGWIRSGHLAQYISQIQISPQARILEVGSGVGRNLAVLKFAGYHNVSGIELNENSIETMRLMLPVLSHNIVHQGPVEDIIYKLETDAFDLVFTMAVLEHLPPESNHVFKEMVRITKKYLLTIEDERGISPRHFPRNYKKVFSKLGLKQVAQEKNPPGLSRNFILRLFVKEGTH